MQAGSRDVLREYEEPVHHEESSTRPGHSRDVSTSPSLEIFKTELLQNHEEPDLTSHLAYLGARGWTRNLLRSLPASIIL